MLIFVSGKYLARTKQAHKPAQIKLGRILQRCLDTADHAIRILSVCGFIRYDYVTRNVMT